MLDTVPWGWSATYSAFPSPSLRQDIDQLLQVLEPPGFAGQLPDLENQRYRVDHPSISPGLYRLLSLLFSAPNPRPGLERVDQVRCHLGAAPANVETISLTGMPGFCANNSRIAADL